jgi:hypothetical protein
MAVVMDCFAKQVMVGKNSSTIQMSTKHDVVRPIKNAKTFIVLTFTKKKRRGKLFQSGSKSFQDAEQLISHQVTILKYCSTKGSLNQARAVLN